MADYSVIIEGRLTGFDQIEKRINDLENKKISIDAAINQIDTSGAQKSFDAFVKACESRTVNLNVTLPAISNQNIQKQLSGTGNIINKNLEKLLQNVTSKKIEVPFTVSEYDSSSFQDAVNKEISRIQQEKNKIVGVSFKTDTYIDDATGEQIESLTGAVFKYNTAAGEAITKSMKWATIDFDSDGNAIKGWVQGATSYSKAIESATKKTDSFEKKREQAVANEKNRLKQIASSAKDKNSSRPITSTESTTKLNEQIDRVNSAISTLENSQADSFSNASIAVQDEITNLKILVKELRNADNVAQSLKGTDVTSGKEIAKNSLEKLKADAAQYPELEAKIRDLDTALSNVGDAASLNAFNDSLRVTRSELDKIKAENSSSSNASKLLTDVSDAKKKLQELSAKNADFSNFSTQIQGTTVTAQDLVNELNQVKTAADFSAVSKKISIFTEAIESAAKKSNDLSKITENVSTGVYDAKSSTMNAKLSAYEGQNSESLTRARNAAKSFDEELQKIKQHLDSSDSFKMNDTEFNNSVEKMTTALKTFQNTMVQVGNESSKNLKFGVAEKSANKVVSYMEANTRAAKEYGAELKALEQQYRSMSTVAEKVQLDNKFAVLKSQISAQGLTGNSMFTELKRAVTQIGQFVSVYGVLQNVMYTVPHQIIGAIKDVDSAMTNLYKVTEETEQRYQSFTKTAASAAKELGRDMSSYINQTANWAKLGYSLDDSEKLSKLSSIYANVGEVSDATAVSDMVTAMKAFNIEASNAVTIIDSLNILGNDFATSSADLGEGLSKSASSMKTAGSDLYETLAMLTGGAEITQSAGEFGNFLKIASMRIRGMKGELEELGEEVDDNVDSISKVQTQILNLTHGKVNIFDSNGEFRDYYKIMEEISAIHDSLSSTDQASLDEILFGKQRGNQGAALIQAFQSGQVQKAYQETLNSEGSAQQEQDRWMKSIEAKIGTFKATFQEFSNTLISSNLVKGIIDGATTILDIITQIIDKFGTLQTLIAGFGAYKGISSFVKNFEELKNIGNLISAFKSGGDIAKSLMAFDSLQDAADALKKIKGIAIETDGVVALQAAFKGTSTEVAQAALGVTQLGEASAGAESSVSGLGAAFTGFIASNKIVLGITAVVAGVAALAAIIDAVTVTAEESMEKLAEMASEYENNASEIDSLNSELETTKSRMEELQVKGHLSLTEEGELEKLKLQNDQLERTIALKEAEQKLAAKSLIKQADETYEKYTESNSEYNTDDIQEKLDRYVKDSESRIKRQMDYATLNDWDKFWSSPSMNSEDGVDLLAQSVTKDSNVNTLIAYYKALEQEQDNVAEKMQEISDKGNVATESELSQAEQLQSYSDQLDDRLSNISGDLNDYMDEMSTIYDQYLEAESQGIHLTDQEEQNKQAIEQMFRDFSLLVKDSYSTAEQSINSILAKAQFAEVKQSLIEAGKSGQEVLEKVIQDTPGLTDALADANVQADQLVDYIMALADPNGVKIDAMADLLKEKFTAKGNSGDIWDSFSDSHKPEEIEVFYRYVKDNDLDISDWSAEDLEYNMKVALDSQSVEDAAEDAKSGFEKILDSDFLDEVDDYTEKIDTIKEALEDLASGDFDNKELVGLMKTFPQLSGKTKNLDQELRSLAKTLNTNMMSGFSSQFNNLNTSDDIAKLQAFEDAVLSLGQTIDDTSFSFDIDTEVDAMDNLYGAMKNSVSGTGLTNADIENVKNMFSDLDGYDPSVLFEKTYNGIHLNTKALRQLQSQYEQGKKDEINDELISLQDQYSSVSEALKTCTDEQQRADLLDQQASLANRIDEVSTLASQYSGLSSAYNKWILAQSSGEEGDMYDNIEGSLDNIKDLYNQGLIGTNAFRSAVQLMSNVDLSNASPEELMTVYEKGMPKMERYFQEGTTGCENFLEDVHNLNSEWASMNEDGEWEINFGKGSDQDIADALGINVETVQSILRKMSDFGFDIELDSIFSNMDTLQEKVQETEKKVRDLGGEPVDIDIDCDVADIDDEIENANDLIDDLNSKKVRTDVEDAQLEDAGKKLDILIERKHNLENPTYMNISVDEVDESLQECLQKLQEYRNSVNEADTAQIKAPDTSETKAAFDEAERLAQETAEYIAGLDPEIQTEIGVTDTGNVDSIKEQLESDTIHIPVEADSADSTTIQEVKESLGTIDGMNATATVTVNINADGLEELKTKLDNMTSIGDVPVTVTATANGQPDVDSLHESIQAVKDNKVKVVANTQGKNAVDALSQSIKAVGNKVVSVVANVFGTNLVRTLRDEINNLHSKDVNINVHRNTYVNNSSSQASKFYGTAHANGTSYSMWTDYRHGIGAYAGGSSKDWSLPKDERALVNEIGTESIVRDGKWFPIPGGAHVENLKRGDIIFSAAQTAELVRTGKVTSGGGHGKIAARSDGTMSNIHAYSGGKGGFHKPGSGSGTTPVSTSDGDGGNTGGGNNNTNPTTLTDAFTNFLSNIFDWAEVRLNRLNRLTEKWMNKAEKAVRYAYNSKTSDKKIDKQYSNKASYLRKAMYSTNNQIIGNEKAAASYSSFMKKIAQKGGLDKNTIDKIKNETVNGTFNIQEFDTGDKSKRTLAAIQAYQEWYEKMLSCEDAITDLRDQQKDLADQLMNIPIEQATAKIEKYQAALDRLSSAYDAVSGGSTAYLKQVVSDSKVAYNSAKKNYENQKKQQEAVQKDFANKQKQMQKVSGLSKSQKASIKSGSKINTSGLTGNALKTANSYNAAWKRKVDANSSTAEAREYYKKAQSDYKANQNLYKKYKGKPDYQYQNALLNRQTAEQKKINDANQQAARITNRNVQTTKKDRDSAQKQLNNYKSSILGNSSLQLSKAQKNAVKNGKQVSLDGASGATLEALKKYNEYLNSANTATDKYNSALQANADAINNAADSQAEYVKMLQENAKQAFDNVIDYFSSKADLLDSRISNKEAQRNYYDATGISQTGKTYSRSYRSQISNTESAISNKQEELKKAKAAYKANSKNMSEKDRRSALAEIEGLETELLNLKADAADLKSELAQLDILKLTLALDKLSAAADKLEHKLNMIQGHNKLPGESVYTGLINNAGQQISNYEQQNAKLRKQQSGYRKGSKKWQELQDQIVSNESAIDGLLEKQLEWRESLVNIPVELAARKTEKLSKNLEILQKRLENASKASVAYQAGIIRAEQRNAQQTYETAKALPGQIKRKQNQNASKGLSAYKSTIGKGTYSTNKDGTLKANGKATDADKRKINQYNAWRKAISAGKEVNTDHLDKNSNAYKYFDSYNLAFDEYNTALKDKSMAVQDYISTTTELAEALANLPIDKMNEKLEKVNTAQEILQAQYNNLDGYEAKNKNLNKQNAKAKEERDLYRNTKNYTAARVKNEFKNVAAIAKAQGKTEGQKLSLEGIEVGSDAYIAIKNYNAAIDASKTAADNAAKAEENYTNTIRTNAKARFDNVISDYESQQSVQEAEASRLSTRLQWQESMGIAKDSATTKDIYEQSIANNEGLIFSKREELAKAQAAYNANYQDMSEEDLRAAQAQILALQEDIQKTEITNEDLKDSMRSDIYYTKFEKALEKTEALRKSLEAINSIITDDAMYDKNGLLTDIGYAKLATTYKDYESSLSDIATLQEKIATIKSLKGTNGMSDEEYIKELTEAQGELADKLQETASARENVLTIMKSLAQAELDAVNKVIDARKNALQKKKDYYDYDKQLRNGTKELNLLKQQRAAIEGISDLEAERKRKELDQQISDKQESLEDTIQDHLYNIQVEGLEDLKTELQENYEDYVRDLAQNLDKIKDVMDGVGDTVSDAAKNINETIKNILAQYGVSLSDLGIKGYATGTPMVSKSGLYEINERGGEIITTPDGRTYMPLKLGSSVMNAETTSRLMNNLKDAAITGVVSNPYIVEPNNVSSRSIDIHYDSLLTVNGNVDKNILPELQTILKESYEYTTQQLARDFKLLGHR